MLEKFLNQNEKEDYKQLYKELKKKYENKEKENEHLKTILKLRDKEIISLKSQLKSNLNNSKDSTINNTTDNVSHSHRYKQKIKHNNDTINEISKNYIEELLIREIQNIQKEQLLFRNKILTLENYELQILAPKLTTGSTNLHFSTKKIKNTPMKNVSNSVEKIVSTIRNEHSQSLYFHKHKISDLPTNKNGLLSDYRNSTFYNNNYNSMTNNSSLTKTLFNTKKKLDYKNT